MTPSEILELQNELVATLANAVRKPWRFIAVNIEIDEIDGQKTENCLMLRWAKRFRKLVRRDEELPSVCYGQFRLLRDRMIPHSDRPWQSCTLVVSSEGRYRFEFSYDPAKRLNGIHDDQAMLSGFDPADFLNNP